MLRTLLLSASLPALLLAGTAAAQGPLRPGQTHSGTLSSSDAKAEDNSFYDVWTYSGKRGQTVTFTLRSADFDAYLAIGRIQDGRFVPLDSDDDSGGGKDARLEVTLPEDGEYAIRANTLSAGETGSYTLFAQEGATSGVVRASVGSSDGGIGPVTAVGTLRPGQTGSGALEDTDPRTFDGTSYDDWTYAGKRGEEVAVTLRSGAFDAYLMFGKLEDGRFSYVQAEDDGAGGNDSLLKVTLPTDGTYVFRVNTLFQGKGPYTITLSRAQK